MIEVLKKIWFSFLFKFVKSCKKSKNNKNKVTLGGYIFENGLNSVKVKRENRNR